MAIATEAGSVVDAIKARSAPALDTLADTVRQGRRAFARSQHAAEDAADAAVLQIRRRPLSAVMIAAGVGALAGGLIGFWLTRRKI
jgi:ElaB/YqjD/DUF883 family membrane-anchored ribosome-binding protein